MLNFILWSENGTSFICDIHKLEKISASKTIKLLENNELDLIKYRNYKKINEVVDRINNYNFISEIFIEKSIIIAY